MGARLHILLTVFSVMLLGFLAIFAAVQPLVENTLRAEHQDRTRWVAEVMARQLTRSTRNEDDIRERLAELTASLGDVCLGIVESDRALALESRATLGRCLDERELVALLGGLEREHWFGSRSRGERLALATRLPGQRRLIFVTPVRGMRARTATLRALIVLFMGVAILMACVVAYLALTQLIVRPISRLVRAIERVSEGDLDAYARPSGGTELVGLADSFNRLTRKLQQDKTQITHQIAELRLINEKLEHAQDHLVRSEKLATVGQLAAGVAHEIGNPIGIVLGYLELLKHDDVSEEDRRTWIARSAEATERVGGIIRDLLDFARPEPDGGAVTADIGRCIRATLQLLEPQRPFKHVDVVLDAKDVVDCQAQIEERRLQQVLLNLLLNAAHATQDNPGGGRVEIALHEQDGRVLIEVADDGPGMTRQVMRRIFDPFYTTKAPGSGTGLGLSICYNIVTACGGDLRVDSAPQKGARFTLDLPAATRAAPAGPPGGQFDRPPGSDDGSTV